MTVLNGGRSPGSAGAVTVPSSAILPTASLPLPTAFQPRGSAASFGVAASSPSQFRASSESELLPPSVGHPVH